MAVDISKLRKDDEVAVRAKVVGVNGSSVVVSLATDAGWTLRTSVAEIVSHTSRELQVGDRARVVAGNRDGREVTVKALDDGAAWVWVAGFGYETFAACNLERIP